MLDPVPTSLVAGVPSGGDPALVKNLTLVHDADRLATTAFDLNAVLDHLSVGVLIVDHCRVILANACARAILEQKDGLRLERGHLRAESADSTRDLKRAVNLAKSNGGTTQYVLSIDRPSCRQPLLALAVATGSGSVAIYLSDPENRPVANAELISELFGLTPAESAVASLVVQGERLSRIAEKLNISVHTVRCHLKRVFSKTGTERQAELANYIGSLLAKLRFSGRSVTGAAAPDLAGGFEPR